MQEKDDNSKETTNQNAEWCREQGKLLFWDKEADAAQRKYAVGLLVRAQQKGDSEAAYIVGTFLVKGILRSSGGNSVEHGLSLISSAANHGWIQARSFLDAYCDARYRYRAGASQCEMNYDGPLKDFDGKPINISRKGLMTPVDAELKYEDGKNILTFSANIQFVYADDPINQELYEQAVLDGIRQWQGTYQVFGGQKLEVRIQLTTEERVFDNVVVMQMGPEIAEAISRTIGMIGTKEKKIQVTDFLKNQRSFAVSGIKWKSTSRKIIYMQSPQAKFNDYKELKAVAKHEFGHTLGLGDLYSSPQDLLPGIEKGTYEEIDSYYISNKCYNLVMCDHHGPISNNDIEMVVLAFRENKMQHYQLSKIGKKYQMH